MICLLFAHPYPDRSRANRELLAAVSSLEGVEVRGLYDLYPDFDIDVDAEQAALVRARAVVFQHPLYWYSVPGLLKHWFDKVLVRGFAYGPGARALHGKRCLWVTTTGGERESYAEGGVHARPSSDYVPVVEQTARFRRHNVKLLDSLIPHFHDEARRLSLAKSGRAELERQFEQERAEIERGRGHLGWHSEEQEG